MNARTLQYAVIGLIVFILLGLGGLYLYLRTQTVSIEGTAAGRGLGEPIPSYGGNAGSTFENIVAGLGFREEQPVVAEEKKIVPRLWQVLASPIAGHGFVVSSTSTSLRSIERSTGHVFAADLEKGDVRRVTNTLVPKVYHADFSSDGSLIGRTIDEGGTVSYFTGIIGAASSTDTLSPLILTKLGSGIIDIMPSGAREFVSLVADGNGSVLIRSRWDGSSPKRIGTIGLRDWHLVGVSSEPVLVQKAATSIEGSAYRFGARTTSVVKNIAGLTLLPRPGSKDLLVGSDSGSVSLAYGTSGTDLRTLSIRTLPEKCVWAPGKRVVAYCAVPENISSNRFLDDHYRGALRTNDAWWKIDIASSTTELLFDPKSEGKSLDVESPRIDDRGAYLSFIDARDRSLWVLRIAP